MSQFRQRTAQDRFFEIIPGVMFWTTLIAAIYFSFTAPAWVAVFIILFDLYWLLKATNTALHMLSAHKRFQMFMGMSWMPYLEGLRDFGSHAAFLEKQEADLSLKPAARKYFREESQRIRGLMALTGRRGADYRELYHVILYPYANESFEILETSLRSLSAVPYPKDRIIVILASEERAGQPAAGIASRLKDEFAAGFFAFFVTVHPDGLEGELKGKSANASWAMRAVVPELEKAGINPDNVVVSNFDSDTIIHNEYLARVSYEYLTAPNPHRASYQPIPVYNNNMWDSPALVRLVAINNTFFQILECSRPNRLRTFSSHSMSLRALIDVGYWRKDLVNEDGYIFWQCYLHYEGDYRVIPLFVSISLDTCLAGTLKQTLINQYKQKRRWAYNVEYYPTLIPGLLKSKAPLGDRMYKLWQYVEGDYNWATASIIISTLGYLPLYLGGAQFNQSVIALNLPLMTKIIMTIATSWLIISVYLNMMLLPPRPPGVSAWRLVTMYLQWFLVPIISIVFGSLPGIDAQTRLMLGRYMEFWVTPKERKSDAAHDLIHKPQTT